VHFTQSDHRGVYHEIDAKVTKLDIVGDTSEEGGTHAHPEAKTLMAGSIARVRGLAGVRVGARLGSTEDERFEGHFPQPTLESVIRPQREEQQHALRAALIALSDEDPLIQIRIIPGGATSVLLYGEVQKEVITERLRREFGVETVFSITTPVYVERPIGIGEAELAIDPLRDNDFWATVGLKVSPTKIGEGNRYVRDVIFGLMPAAFYRIVEESVMRTLEQGLYGWRVTDCEVRLTSLGFDRPITVAADFRCLVPIVLMRALRSAGTSVYEPCHSFELEAPDDSLSSILRLLSLHEARVEKVEKLRGNTQTVFGAIPVRLAQSVTASLSGLTGGEGSLMVFPGADRRVTRDFPTRLRTDGNPLNYDEYMRYLTIEGLMP
jgi:ribosomal protection tetracycline resistance protein